MKSGIIFSLLSFAVSAEELKPLQWSGDFRYRFEQVNQQNATPETYDQHRIRARLGAKAVVNESADIEARLATASPGRTSTNQTLGGSASAYGNYAFLLDRAFFSYRPHSMFNFLGGRMGNVFYQPGGNDLLWDADLNFDGLAAVAEYKMESLTPFLVLTHYYIDKGTTATAKDVNQQSAMAGVRYKGDDLAVSGGVGYHTFPGLKNHTGLTSTTSTNGNSGTTTGTGTSATRTYTYDYKLLTLGADVDFKVMDQSMVIFGEYVTNSDPSDEKSGFIVGIKWGKTKEAGDWMVMYDYRELQRDAAVGAFVDGDSYGGGTNGRSHRIGAGYQVAERMTANIAYYMGKTPINSGATSNNFNKLHADLNFKF